MGDGKRRRALAQGRSGMTGFRVISHDGEEKRMICQHGMMYKELSREYEFKQESVAKADITKDYFPL